MFLKIILIRLSGSHKWCSSEVRSNHIPEVAFHFLHSWLLVWAVDLLINSFNRFLQVIPKHKKSGDKIPYVALCLCVNQNILKPGCTLSAVFELSIYNHSKGTYRGCKGSSWTYSFKYSHLIKLRVLIPPSFISFSTNSQNLEPLSII